MILSLYVPIICSSLTLWLIILVSELCPIWTDVLNITEFISHFLMICAFYFLFRNLSLYRCHKNIWVFSYSLKSLQFCFLHLKTIHLELNLYIMWEGSQISVLCIWITDCYKVTEYLSFAINLYDWLSKFKYLCICMVFCASSSASCIICLCTPKPAYFNCKHLVIMYNILKDKSPYS